MCVRACLTSVIFLFISIRVFIFQSGLLFICLSFANFSMWNILPIERKTAERNEKIQIVQILCTCLSCWQLYASRCAVFIFIWFVCSMHLFVFLVLKLNDWNVTTKYNCNKPKQKQHKNRSHKHSHLQSRTYEIHSPGTPCLLGTHTACNNKLTYK